MIATTLLAAGCADLGDDASSTDDHATSSENGLAFNGLAFNGLAFNGLAFNGFGFNGLAFNGLAFNGLAFNGLAFNGLAFNGLATAGGLSSTNGLMTTEGGREFVRYLVRIAFPAGHNLTKLDQYNNSYTFEGSLGIAPEFEFGECDMTCQEKISSAMLAHVNNSGLHVGIWLVGPDSGVGWGSSPNFPYQEAAYFGNLFVPNMPGYYCGGRDMGAGNVKGRLGSPFGTNSNVLTSPYGWLYDSASQQNIPVPCATGGATPYCQSQNEGFSSCRDVNSTTHAWTHPVTVYRNFEQTMLYKICNKASGKCLGVVNGSMSNANVEQRAYNGATGQTWQVVQVSTGAYKILNKTSGMSLDVSGTQVVQRPYAGQTFPLAFFVGEPGVANLKLASNPGAVFWNSYSSADGALIQTASVSTADSAKWTFTAVGPVSIDPGRPYRLVPQNAPTKSIDIANGSTANGTAVQIYDTWNGDQQKLIMKDAGKGNVKLTMKANTNKCLGPRGGAPVAGAKLEVQDCTGSNNQAWLTGETAAGSGVFLLKNVAAPFLCVDVTGASAANGAQMQIATCTANSNQLFSTQPQ